MLKSYDDLSPYEYYMPCPIPEIRNIGWLDKDHSFETGDVDPKFLKKLEKLIFNSYRGSCNIFVNKLRGSYECLVCGEDKATISNGQNEFTLGSSELWIPDNEAEGHYFATFGLIIHYIKEHHYQPPQEFINSVLALDLNINFNGDDVRDTAVSR